MVLPLAMPQSFPFFMQLASNTQHRRSRHTPFSRALLTAHPSLGSLLSIPVSLANKVTEITVHPFSTNTVFPVALCELLCNSTLRAADFPFSFQNHILGLTEYFVAPPNSSPSESRKLNKSQPKVTTVTRYLAPRVWTFWTQLSESPPFPGNYLHTFKNIRGFCL